jgi:hypothetical protein
MLEALLSHYDLMFRHGVGESTSSLCIQTQESMTTFPFQLNTSTRGHSVYEDPW